MLWSITGLTLALTVAVVALRCSRSPGGYYDRLTYGMSSATHRGYAALSAGFALYFAFVLSFRLQTAGIAGLALYALVAIFYGTSFLRGASDE